MRAPLFTFLFLCFTRAVCESANQASAHTSSRAGGLIVDAGSKKAASLASVLRERADQVEARLAARLAERQALAAAQQEAREQAKRLAAEEAACKVAAVEAKQALARELQV